MTVYADRDLYKDIWWEYRKWMQKYRDVPGFYGLHCNMPITPRSIEQGVLKGGNALGLEGTTDQTLGGNPYLHSFCFCFFQQRQQTPELQTRNQIDH